MCERHPEPSMLDQITPVLLTYNEAVNIGRTLSYLAWAKDIVVVDSGSTDETRAIMARIPQVRVFSRAFDTHGNQWDYAVHKTGIATPWILRLDADYQVSETLREEMSQLDPSAPVSAYRISFDYAIFARRLISSCYPANTILLRKGCFSVHDRGHTEAWTVEGPIKELKAHIIHDDWKSTESWLNAQRYYMRRELDTLHKRSGLGGWVRRKPPLMPIAIFLYCLFGKGLLLNGRAGMFYALQRMVAEATLSIMVLEQRLLNKGETRPEQSRNVDCVERK
jgi:glycosyltransferase involved in cell wall biosynthesis